MDFGIDSLGPKLDSISVQIATKFGFSDTSSNGKLIYIKNIKMKNILFSALLTTQLVLQMTATRLA
jgi:hypothetical protein